MCDSQRFAHVHVCFQEKKSLYFQLCPIHTGLNNAPLDSPVGWTNGAQSALSSLWICPQHLFTKLSGANRLARNRVRAALLKRRKKNWNTERRNCIYRSEKRKGRKGGGGGENYQTEIKDSFAAQKIWASSLPFPDRRRLLRSAAPSCRSQIAWLNSHVALTLSDIYIPIEVFLFLKF